MNMILTAGELKQALKHVPENTKVILSTADVDRNILSKDFARNICISSDNEMVVISNKPLYSINHILD